MSSRPCALKAAAEAGATQRRMSFDGDAVPRPGMEAEGLTFAEALAQVAAALFNSASIARVGIGETAGAPFYRTAVAALRPISCGAGVDD